MFWFVSQISKDQRNVSGETIVCEFGSFLAMGLAGMGFHFLMWERKATVLAGPFQAFFSACLGLFSKEPPQDR